MTQINQNINLYNQAQYPQAKQKQVVNIPAFYVVPEKPQTFKETMENDPILSIPYYMAIKPFTEHPIGITGTWLGFSVGLDAYAKACSGEYDKSLVGKIARFGDNIENSSLIKSKQAQATLHGIGSIYNKSKQFVNKHPILNATINTPTRPELPLVKSQLYTQEQETVQEFIKIIDALKLDSKGTVSLSSLDLDKNDIKNLKQYFNVDKISKISNADAANYVQLKRLGKTDTEIKMLLQDAAKATENVKSEILKTMKLDTDKINLIKTKCDRKCINDVIEATKNVKNNVRIGTCHYKWLGPITKLFERQIGCEAVYNKLHSMNGGAKTATGKFLSKSVQTLHRALTFGNGKLGALFFIAPLLFEIGVNVTKADKDQKVGTAAHGFVDNISWVFTFPLALKAVHALGGMKFAGMSKDKVDEYYQLIDDFNNKFKNDPTLKYDDYKKQLAILKEQLANKLKVYVLDKKTGKLKDQNLRTRMLRKISSALTLDLGKVKSYRNGHWATNILLRIPQGLRNLRGVPLRIILFAATMFGIENILSKGVTAIFGKSYDSMKQDERKTNKKEQINFLRKDLNERLYKAQWQKQYGALQANNSNPTTNITQENIQNIPLQNGNGMIKEPENIFKPNNVENQPIYNIPEEVFTTNNVTTNQNTNNSNVILPENKTQNTIEELSPNNDEYSYIPSENQILKETKQATNIDNYSYIPSTKNALKTSSKGNSIDKYSYIPNQKNTLKVNTEKQESKYVPSQNAAKINGKSIDTSSFNTVLSKADEAENNAIRILAGNFD